MLPKITPMKQPMTRGAFEERINLVREQLISGKLHPQGMESLFSVRLLPNGRIDMLSIDESVRLNANMTHQMIATDMGKMLRRMAEANDGESNDE